MNLPACTNPKQKGRCSACPACRASRLEIGRILDAGGGVAELMMNTGVSLTSASLLLRHWKDRTGRLAAALAAATPRPRCDCGLTIDKDHTPETCDMRIPRSTGMGQMGALTW